MRFLDMLPRLPTTVTASAPGVGNADVLLASVDRGKLIAYAPQKLMDEGLELLVELRDAEGAGRDVRLRVERAFYQVDGQTMLYLRVLRLDYRAGQREQPRIEIEGDAYCTVVSSSRLQAGQEVHVWLADISATGIAFLTELEPAVDDRMVITIDLNGRPVSMEARVRRVDTAPLARNRVAADTAFQHDWDRAAIARLTAAGAPVVIDSGVRQPELRAARSQSRAELHQLQARMALRRYQQIKPD